MKNNRPIAMLTMAGILLPTVACNSRDVLLVVRDAAADQPAELDAANPGAGGASGIAGTGGSGGAVASSGADASASAGGSADVAVSGTTDSGSALGTPKGFRIVNATTHTVYVDLGHPVKCRAQDASGWQACEFFGLWCLLDCQFFQPGDQCCEQCDAGEPSLLAVPAGGSRTIAWTGSLFAARAGYCSGCECQEQSAVGQGTYEATVRAYDQYACVGGQPCPEQPDGTIRDAVPQGSYQEPAVQFAIPSAAGVRRPRDPANRSTRPVVGR